MKLATLSLLILIITVGLVSHSSGQEPDSDEEEELGGVSCVFSGCSCGGDGAAEYETDKKNEDEDAGIDIRCKLDDNTSQQQQQQQQQQPVDFPQRIDTTKRVITSLDMSAIGLTSIPAGQFAGLEVSVADLSKNSIGSISEQAFDGMLKLDVLELSANQIADIQPRTFTAIETVLVQLALKHNRLSQMDPARLGAILSRLSNLRSLYLDNNGFTRLPSLAKMSGKLEDISLGHNQIESLSDAVTGEQLLPASVMDLQLANNRLKHLTRKTFEGLRNLKYLYLDSNQISQIDADAFAHLTRLNALYLSKNYIKQVPTRALYPLVSLERLDLAAQNQMLREIDDHAFDRQSNAVALRKVDLSKNRIARVASKAFCSKNRTHPYANVKDIDLAGNQLTSLSACVLRQMSRGYEDYKNGQLQQQQQQQQIVGGKQQQQQHQHHQSQAAGKTRVNLKAPSMVDKMGPSVRCDCEVTKAGFFVDMEGECENSAGVLVPLGQFKCNSDIQFSVEFAEAECVARPEFNCLDASGGGGQAQVTPGSGGRKQPVVNDKNNIDSSKNKENKPSNQQVTRLPSSVDSAAATYNRVTCLVVTVVTAVTASSLFYF
jgi:Leucine-rich repeat (LRR) protein